MTREERNERMRRRYAEHKEDRKKYQKKYNAEHKDEVRAKVKKWRAEHRKEFNAKMKKRQAEDLNQNGVTKNRIRKTSSRILKKCHTKLPGYEIHHCFGYEDPEKFIYIPKSLHLQIHKLLRDSNISADSNHWDYIKDLVNSSELYTYIKS